MTDAKALAEALREVRLYDQGPGLPLVLAIGDNLQVGPAVVKWMAKQMEALADYDAANRTGGDADTAGPRPNSAKPDTTKPLPASSGGEPSEAELASMERAAQHTRALHERLIAARIHAKDVLTLVAALRAVRSPSEAPKRHTISGSDAADDDDIIPEEYQPKASEAT